MKINKVKNMSTNIIYGMLSKVVAILFPFIIRTVIINVLSSEYLGLTSLFTSILQALNLMEVGIGSALVFNMYVYVANNDKEKLGNFLAFYKKCYRIIGTIILLIGICILPFLNVFIKGEVEVEINIYILYIIYLINTVLTYWLFAYKNSIALAYQRTDIESKILSINQTLMYIMQIIVLLIFKNYYMYIILLPIFTVLKNIMVSYKIDKIYPDIKPLGDITKEEKKSVIQNVKALFGHQVAFTVINSVDNIILSAFLGLNELAIYNNYYYILNAIINIFTLLFTSIQAGIGNSIIVDSKEIVYNGYKKFRLFVYILASLCSLCLFTMYQPFMKMWMGDNMMLSKYSMIIFVLGFYVTQIRRVVTTYKNAAGMWKDDFFKPYVVIIVDIIIDFLLIKKVGSIGAMIATILSMGLIAIPWENFILFKMLFNKNLISQYYFMIKQFIAFVISILICNVLVNIINVEGIIALVIYGGVAVVTGLIINYLFNFNSLEMKWIIGKVKGYFKRGKNNE